MSIRNSENRRVRHVHDIIIISKVRVQIRPVESRRPIETHGGVLPAVVVQVIIARGRHLKVQVDALGPFHDAELFGVYNTT